MRSETRLLLLLLLAFSCGSLLRGQVISYQKLASFSVQQVDSIASTLGVPTFLLGAEHPVDYYKVLYLTPYKHPDSLVQASMGLAIPQSPGCEFPLIGWGHGTTSRRYPAASSMNGGNWDLGVLFASVGYITALPDYLGLGDSDPRVLIHPYIHRFSQANTMINALRASRTVADTTNAEFNQQVFLFGYSQGGFTTAATVKEIQENHAQEFQIAASAPMSGPYDLKDAQVDLIASDSVYSVPGYLPFLLLGYQSMYGTLYDSIQEAFKSPFDTVLPPLFYGGNVGLGTISSQCTPVPKHMIQDSVVNAFLSDSLHPLRLVLADNHLADGWFPTSPMRLFYCDQDEEVSYLNAINAYNNWTAAGAPDLGIQNMGSYGHFACASYALMAGKLYFDGYRLDCGATGIEFGALEKGLSVYPNPASGILKVSYPVSGQPVEVNVYDLAGRKWMQLPGDPSGEMRLDVKQLPVGMYWVEVVMDGNRATRKWVIAR